MTIQPLKKAVAIVCSNRVLFPLILSPTMTFRVVVLLGDSASTKSLAMSVVSSLTNAAGRLNSRHPCVGLNTSAAFSWSTTGPGMPNTRPCTFVDDMFFALMSSIPGTTRALVLLRMTRFRSAFRSPGAGGLVVVTRVRFFILSCLTPFCGAEAVALVCFFFAGTNLSCRVCEVVENAAMRPMVGGGCHEAV